MARSRIIKHDFWTSEDIIELEPIERLFFIGFWNFADDSGVLPDKPKTLKCMIFPADNIDCKPLVDNLVNCGLLSRYIVGDDSFLIVSNWDKHQTIKYPTFKYPLESGEIPESSQRKRTKKKHIGIGIDIGVEEVIPEHVENMSGTCPEPQRQKPSKKSFKPPTLEEVIEFFKEKKTWIDPEAFYYHYESNGWMRGKAKIKKWKACLITWEKRTPRPPEPPKQRTIFDDNEARGAMWEKIEEDEKK